MLLTIRGYKIKCYAKPGNVAHYRRLYESYDDERLGNLERESNETQCPYCVGQELQGSRSK